MKHKLAQFALCLSALPSVAAGPQTAPPPPTMMKFHSDVLHLDYSFPASFAQRDTSKDAGHRCGNQPISAVDATGGFRMILVQDEDGDCLNKDLTPGLVPRATLMANALLKRFGTPSVVDVTAYQIGAHHVVTTNGFVFDAATGKTHYVAVSCQMIGKHAVCWELLTFSCSALAEMESYPITFSGEPPALLIPDSLKPECK